MYLNFREIATFRANVDRTFSVRHQHVFLKLTFRTRLSFSFLFTFFTTTCNRNFKPGINGLWFTFRPFLTGIVFEKVVMFVLHYYSAVYENFDQQSFSKNGLKQVFFFFNVEFFDFFFTKKTTQLAPVIFSVKMY